MRVTFGLLILTSIFSLPVAAKRIRSARQAPASKVAPILSHARLIGVFCGDDVEWQTCKLFAHALEASMRSKHVNVILKYQPEVMVQSFYVPPMPFPYTDVTVRLIESDGATEGIARRVPTDRDGITRVYLGGDCFDPNSSDELGLMLPIWVESEGNKDTGPLESDRANAAGELAKEFHSWWDEVTIRKARH